VREPHVHEPHSLERDDPYPHESDDLHGAVSGGTIARITVLLQAHAATEALIRNALGHAEPGAPIEGILYETLRHDPPVRALNRIDEKTGGRVTIDVVAANRDPRVFTDPDRFDATRGPASHLTFGSGLRPCPAPAHALALAAGVLEAVPG
jgi:cytochrome P450